MLPSGGSRNSRGCTGMLADTSVEITSDFSTPAVLGLVVLGTIIVVLALFGQHSIASARAARRGLGVLPDELGLSALGGQRPKGELLRANPFKDPRERRAALRRDGNPVGLFGSS